MKRNTSILNNIYFQIFVYYVLILSSLPIIGLISTAIFNKEIDLSVVNIILFIVFILVPIFLFIKNAFRTIKYSLNSILNLIFTSFLIVFPIGFTFQLGLYAIGHYGTTWPVILASAKFGSSVGLFASILGLLTNFIFSKLKKAWLNRVKSSLFPPHHCT